MNTRITNMFLLPALIAVLCLIPAGRVTAQTFTVVHYFGGFQSVDGGHPKGALILSGDTLYGTAVTGGSLGGAHFGYGTVFAVNPNGTGFRNLYVFTGGSDGGDPGAGLILSGNTLYGTT